MSVLKAVTMFTSWTTVIDLNQGSISLNCWNVVDAYNTVLLFLLHDTAIT